MICVSPPVQLYTATVKSNTELRIYMGWACEGMELLSGPWRVPTPTGAVRDGEAGEICANAEPEVEETADRPRTAMSRFPAARLPHLSRILLFTRRAAAPLRRSNCLQHVLSLHICACGGFLDLSECAVCACVSYRRACALQTLLLTKRWSIHALGSSSHRSV